MLVPGLDEQDNSNLIAGGLEVFYVWRRGCVDLR